MHGRLADPNCTIGTDPRSDPRMVKALAPFGLDGNLPAPRATPDSPIEDRLKAVAATEKHMGAALEALAQNMPSPKGVATMPGPVDPERLLLCELVEGAFAGVGGPIRPDWN